MALFGTNIWIGRHNVVGKDWKKKTFYYLLKQIFKTVLKQYTTPNIIMNW